MNIIRDPFFKISFNLVQMDITPAPVVRYFLSFITEFDQYYGMCWRDEEWK